MKKDYWNYSRYANFALSFGITMALSIFLGIFGGTWLDQKFNTSPWLMLLGVFFGVAVTFKSLIAELKVLEKSGDKFSDDDNHKEEE